MSDQGIPRVPEPAKPYGTLNTCDPEDVSPPTLDGEHSSVQSSQPESEINL